MSQGGPELWIIAGANGSGKSTAYGQASIDAPTGSIWIINPDLLAQRIADHERMPLNSRRQHRRGHPHRDLALRLGRRAPDGGRGNGAVDAEVPRAGDRAHAEGFAVRLIYVFLETAELNVGGCSSG